jgi:hypothetical protein
MSMLPAGFEPTILASERPQIHIILITIAKIIMQVVVFNRRGEPDLLSCKAAGPWLYSNL